VPRLEAGVQDLRAGVLPHLTLVLAENELVTVETRDLSPGADPVLHLLSAEEGREAARDDDSGAEPGAARLHFRAPAAGTYLVLLRAYASEDDGFCTVLVNGAARLEHVTFGGSTVLVAAGRTLHAVLLRDGQAEDPWPPSGRAATDTLLLLLDPESGALLALDDDSGVELGSHLVVSSGVPALALVGAYGASEEGAARLVVNDAPLSDTDGDDLGDGLEASLCLCSRPEDTVCGFECRLAVSPEDTDGDGLSDAEELLGADHAEFPQLLPRWGTDPRHKDLFLEIDLARWVEQTASGPVEHMGRAPSTEEAYAAARVFGQLSTMQNPDGADGIRLHLDLGHACGLSASGIDEVCGDLCSLGHDGVPRCGRSWYGGPPAERRAGLAAARLHRFHVAVADCIVAGQSPGGAADSLEYDCDRVTALVHELGHNLGLSHHYGTPETGGGNCKPNYPSLMNYAFSDRFRGGQEVEFSTGSLVGAGDLNPRDLDETVPFGGPAADVGWLATAPFFFELHHCLAPGRGCKVDFNRDGRLDPSVRAYLSPMPSYGFVCEGTHGNALGSENLGELDARSGPAATELMRRLPDGTLAPALHAFVMGQTHDQAALLMSSTFSVSGGWTGWSEIPGLALRADAEPAAATLGEGQAQQIWLFACTDGAEPVRYTTLDTAGQIAPWRPVPGQPPSLRARGVSVALRGPDLVLLLRDEGPAGGDRVYVTELTPAGWSARLAPLSAEGLPLRSLVTPAAAVGPNGRIYVVTADPDPLPGAGPTGRIHFYSGGAITPAELRDEELWGLRFEDGRPGHQHEAWARPALAFLPHLDGAGQPLSDRRGTLALFWSRGTRTRFLFTSGRLDDQGAGFSLGRWHHYEAYGYTDAIAGTGPALALRSSGHLAALISQSNLAPAKVRHIPFADGVPEETLVLRDFDDRPALRENLCRSLNWDCPGRCARLSETCTAGSAHALTEIICELPRPEPSFEEEP
jgi:hypothetical protein